MTGRDWRTRARALVVRFEKSRTLTQGKPWALAIALVVFVWISVVSIAGLPDTANDPSVGLLLPIAVLTVGTLVINGLEFMVAGRLIGQRVGLPLSLQTSVLSSAANVLPIPGAALVRIRALREVDVPYRRAVASTALVGIAWLGASAIGAGVFLLWQGHTSAGVICLVLGLCAMALGPVVLRPPDGRVVIELIAVEAASMIVTTLRLFFVARASGYGLSMSSSAILGLSGVLASAAGIFPGGLGLREAISAATAPITSVDPAVAVVISAMDRIAFYIVLAMATLLLFTVRWRSRTTRSDDAVAAAPTDGGEPCG